MSEANFDSREAAVLDRRAAALAKAATTRAARSLVSTVALVGVGKDVLGVPVGGMSEIVRTPPITPLPGLPAHLPGIVQIRGEVLGAVHLGRWLGIDAERADRYLVVLAGFEVPLGLLVGSVLGFRDVYEDELAANLRDEEQRRRPVSHTTRDLVSVLDLAALVRSPDLRLARGP